MICHYDNMVVQTGAGLILHDVTADLESVVSRSGVIEGLAALSALHTTTALSINENEARLLEDIRDCYLRLVPPDVPYRHNDIHLRDCPPDEPENAHAHLIAMMLGNSEVIPVHEGRLMLGQWQSVLLVELDGPRERSVAVQVLGM